MLRWDHSDRNPRPGLALRLFPRLVLGYTIALLLIVPLTARSVGTPYTIAVTMQSPVPGHLQVFYEAGEGFSEAQSAELPLKLSDAPHEYRLALPSGRFRSFRIDPGTQAGRYVIERVAILNPDGSVRHPIPLAALAPAYQISVVEQSATRLVVEAPPGLNDPQLVYVPKTPVIIPRRTLNLVVDPRVRSLLVNSALLWLVGIGVIWLVERALGARLGSAIGRAAAACHHNPRTAIFQWAASGLVLGWLHPTDLTIGYSPFGCLR
jgi:hypothetical protein